MPHMAKEAPKPVKQAFEKLDRERDGYHRLRERDGRWYVYHATSVWDKEEKKPKKVEEYLGKISLDGNFVPKTPRPEVPVTNREVFEFANGQLADYLLEDVKRTLPEYSPYTEELIAMAIIRAIDPQPLRLHPSRWEKLYLSQQREVRIDSDHLSSVLQHTGEGKAWWHEFFSELMKEGDLLLYDLTSIFSWSEKIKRVEKGYNADKLYRDQLGVILAFNTETGLPIGVDVHWGSMKDITTFREFVDLLDYERVGFIVDRGLFDEGLIRDFAAEGIQYVVPLKKNSRFADPKYGHWRSAFEYQERYIQWAKRHYDLGTVYLFEDPEVKGQQEKALMRKESKGEITREKFEKKRERAGIVAILSNLDRTGPDIYELYKGRNEVELAFDAMKNHLDADKTNLQTDEAVRGYFFVTFLALRIYFAVLTRLREHELNQKISVEEVFWELRKVERIKKPGGKEVFAQIPKQARKIVDVFPNALPMG